MAKWFGKIGYGATTVEVEPGLWEEQTIEREYFGDLITDRRKRQASGVNDDINISNSISIIADPFAVQNCSKMAYVEFLGAKWKISDIEVQYPRLILSIGGVWNENQSGTSNET